MAYFLLFFSFVLGAVVGSFLNVVVLRHGTGTSLGGRSRCFSCNHTLHWRELIPIVSFFIARGHCRHCRSRISWQYPAVEFVTGVLFAAVWLFLSTTPYNLQPTTYPHLAIALARLVLLWFILSSLVALTVYDLRHKIIPNSFVYPFIASSFLFLLTTHYSPFTLPPLPLFTTHYQLLTFFSGPVLFFFFFSLWAVSGGRWMGFGDAKLALGIGWLLGMRGGITATILAFWIGATVSVLLVALSRAPGLFRPAARLTIKSEVPFAPFLVIGTLIVLFFNFDVFRFFV